MPPGADRCCPWRSLGTNDSGTSGQVVEKLVVVMESAMRPSGREYLPSVLMRLSWLRSWEHRQFPHPINRRGDADPCVELQTRIVFIQNTRIMPTQGVVNHMHKTPNYQIIPVRGGTATGGGRWTELLCGRSLDRGGGATTCEFPTDTADSRSDALDLVLRDSTALRLGVTFRGIGAGREGNPLSLSSASIVELAGVLERECSVSVGDDGFPESVVFWRAGTAGERERTGVGDGVNVDWEIKSSGSTRAGTGRGRTASFGFSPRSSWSRKRKSSPNSSSSCSAN